MQGVAYIRQRMKCAKERVCYEYGYGVLLLRMHIDKYERRFSRHGKD